MQHHLIMKLLKLEERHLRMTGVHYEGPDVHVDIEYAQGHHVCPCCGHLTSKVHDYRIRTVRHGNIQGYHVILHYRRRRYVCKHCFTRFPEPNGFVTSHAQISNMTKHMIVRESQGLSNYKMIAQDLNVSQTTILRQLDLAIKVKRLKLPEVISFDEFKKTNQGYGKYAFIMTDPINRKIIDIMRNRRSDWLRNYFGQIPKDERNRVRKVIIDLWAPYRTVIKSYFPKAEIIADTFHFTRYIYWAFNDVRIRIMNTFKKESTEYRVLKKHWKTLCKSPLKLKEDYRWNHLLGAHVNELMIQDYASNIHPDMEEATRFKDTFLEALEQVSPDGAVVFIDGWIKALRHARTKEFKEILKTFINWKQEIINAFQRNPVTGKKYTNGMIEGTNNYVKTLNRIGFGYRNFERFRNRIMSLFNHDFVVVG
jgi:transposase